MSSTRKKGSSLGKILVIIFILAIVFVSLTVDLITCPQCDNNILIREFCSICGHDGKVTVIQYILFILAHE